VKVLYFVVAIALFPFSIEAQESLEENETQARSYFAIGRNYFNMGQYDEAIKAFEEGYRLKPRPKFLFNIAATALKAGKTQVAIDYYQKYIDSEPAKTSPMVREAAAQVDALRRRASREPPPSEPPPSVITEAPPPPVAASVVVAPPPPPHRPVWKRGWFWGTIAGVAAAGLAVGLGVGLGTRPSDPRPSLGTVPF
jgi:iron complex outermembrane receptor protein